MDRCVILAKGVHSSQETLAEPPREGRMDVSHSTPAGLPARRVAPSPPTARSPPPMEAAPPTRKKVRTKARKRKSKKRVWKTRWKKVGGPAKNK